MYCGEAPLVANGYAYNSTGVQYNNTVEYKCFGGFNALNYIIKCQADGTWETAPLCNGFFFTTNIIALEFGGAWHLVKLL